MKPVKLFEDFATNEMAKGDIYYTAIMKHYNDATDSEKKKIAKVIIPVGKADEKSIENELAEMDYKEIADLAKELGINVHESKINEDAGTNGMILDLVDQIQSVINNLKKDKNLVKPEVDRLFTLSTPFVKALHNLVK